MDLRLSNYDMAFENGDVSFVRGAEAVGQDVTMNLRTFLGESKYDKSKGVPYREIIFQRGTDVATIEQILRSFILSIPGVLTIEELTINELDYVNRTLSLSGFGTCSDGEFDFSGPFPTPL